MKQKFNVTGMTCSACSAHVEKAVNKLEGVKHAEQVIPVIWNFCFAIAFTLSQQIVVKFLQIHPTPGGCIYHIPPIQICQVSVCPALRPIIPA